MLACARGILGSLAMGAQVHATTEVASLGGEVLGRYLMLKPIAIQTLTICNESALMFTFLMHSVLGLGSFLFRTSLLRRHKVAKINRQPIRMISDTPQPEGYRDTLQLVRRPQGDTTPRHFALMSETCQSPSELRSLSGLRNTDGCTNYRTDPVRV